MDKTLSSTLLTLGEARERACLSMTEMAARAGLTVGAVLKIERGRSVPQPRTKRAIAAVLNMRPEEIAWPTAPAGVVPEKTAMVRAGDRGILLK